MLRVCLLFALLSLASAADFRYSTVITSADVPVDQPKQLNLPSSNHYRVYATYASTGPDDYARNVYIYDNYGYGYNLYILSQPLLGTGYILDPTYQLRSPIYIHDQNKGGAVTPFTVYVVDYTSIPFPVVSARLAPQYGLVDSNYGLLAAGVTVLSAENYFTMYSFDIGNIASMSISSVGFDEAHTAYNMLSFNSPNQARLSFLSVYGPIATLFNTNWGSTARFQFQFTRNTKYDFQLAPGASFAFASPGYLSKDDSYNIPSSPSVADALDRSYNFGVNNWISSYYTVGDVQNGENILFQVTSDNQAVSPITISQASNNNRYAANANRVSMKVQNQNGNHVPRFLFQIDSGSSLSFSLIGVIVVSLFKNFY